MNLILCLDDKNGIRFNHRRQSRDKEVYRNIGILVGSMPLSLNEKSLSLFNKVEALSVSLIDENTFPDEISWMFIEEVPSPSLLSSTSTLYVFRWNRDYPADEYVDLSGWHLIDSCDFKGTSHEKITREVYVHD